MKTPTNPAVLVSVDMSLHKKSARNLRLAWQTFKEVYEQELNKTEAGRTTKEMAGKLAKTAKDTVQGVSDSTTKIIDNISGAEANAKIQQLLETQQRFNDILATRLAEALDRIEHLEREVERLSNGR